MSTVEKTGKTVEEALQEALKELNLTQDQVDVEIVDEPKKALLGLIGGRKAKVRVTPKAEQAAAAPVAAPAPAAAPEAEVAPAVEKVAPVAAAAKTETQEAPASRLHKDREPREYLVDENAIEAAKAFLNKIFAAMKITVNTEKFINRENGIVTLKLHGDDMGILIGKHGQTLDALQYLTNLVANRAAGGRMRIVIDVEDYRDRRAETLTRLAKRLAEKVKRTGERCALEPMNPHERKIIHTALQGDPTITTLSEGTDPYRKVVIELKK
ncbi:MAG: protein jag [Acidaminococcaceae bacterium]|jgi:spoIIIJ-associated protein|nr:protein jag [Acidaminococcaceae bacterium]